MKAGILPDPATDWRNSLTWPTHKTLMVTAVRAVVIPTLYAVARTECHGLDHIPATGRCILASNHLSNWDPMYLGVLLPRHPYYMAKVELFKNPVIGSIMRLGGTFPIYRGENDAWAMQHAGEVLEADEMLCMFPEGTRSKGKAQLRRGKVGAVKLALDYNALVVPAALTGTENHKLGLRANTVRLQVGPPIDLKTLIDPAAEERDMLRRLTTHVMQQIAAMLPPEYRGAYA